MRTDQFDVAVAKFPCFPDTSLSAFCGTGSFTRFHHPSWLNSVSSLVLFPCFSVLLAAWPSRSSISYKIGSRCFPKIDPALRRVLLLLIPAKSRFSRFFKQKKQFCGFPDEVGGTKGGILVLVENVVQNERGANSGVNASSVSGLK